MRNAIIVIVLLVLILVFIGVPYFSRNRDYVPTGRVSILDSVVDFFKNLFAEPKSERQRLTEDFVQTYLKQEFQPSEIDLTFGLSPYREDKEGKTFYGYFWRTDKERFYVRIEYNKDGETVSHLRLLIFSIMDGENRPVDYYLDIPSVDWDCWDQWAVKNCKTTWFDREVKLEVATNSARNKRITIVMCELFKESEVYDIGCFGS